MNLFPNNPNFIFAFTNEGHYSSKGDSIIQIQDILQGNTIQDALNRGASGYHCPGGILYSSQNFISLEAYLGSCQMTQLLCVFFGKKGLTVLNMILEIC